MRPKTLTVGPVVTLRRVLLPLQPNHKPPLCSIAARTAVTSPPAAASPLPWLSKLEPGGTRLETTISLRFKAMCTALLGAICRLPVYGNRDW